MAHIQFDYSNVVDRFIGEHELGYMQTQVTAKTSSTS